MTQTETVEWTEDVARSREGDRDAFGRIVASHQALVCSVAFSVTGDLAMSEDIAQDVFLTAWQHLHRLREPSRLPSWLAAIARNRARDAMRAGRRDPLHGATPLADANVCTPSAEVPTQEEREKVTWQAVADLPEPYRTPLILYYREGNSVRRVAQLLEISEECTKQRLSRGRKMLRGRVAELVEQTLSETGPGTDFALAVVGALPALTLPSAAGGALAVGAAAAKGGGGKAAAGAAVGALGGLVGAVAGMTGGFFGMWMAIRNTQTLRLRRYMLRCAALTYAFLWVFFGYEALCGCLLWRTPGWMAVACGIGWALYIPLLLLLIVRTNATAARILAEERDNPDRYGAPSPRPSASPCTSAWAWRSSSPTVCGGSRGPDSRRSRREMVPAGPER